MALGDIDEAKEQNRQGNRYFYVSGKSENYASHVLNVLITIYVIIILGNTR